MIALTPLQQQVLDLLTAAAECGGKCPSNHQIAAQTGSNHVEVSRIIGRLEGRGLIQRTSDKLNRTICIIDTGKSCGPRSVRHFVEVAARAAALTPADLCGRARAKLYLRPRFVAIHYALAEGWPMSAIGRELGGRDHSTIIYACSVMAEWHKRDRLFRQLLDRTGALLDGSTADVVAFRPAKVAPVRPAPEPLEGGEEFQGQDERNGVRRGSVALLRAIRAAHPERCAA